MAPFHGAENNTRGSTGCCLAVYRAELPTCRSITWHWEVSRKRKRALSLLIGIGQTGCPKKWHFRAANDGRIAAQVGAHRIRGCFGYTWQKFILRQIEFCRYCVHQRMQLPLCLGLREISNAKNAKPLLSRDALAAAAVEEFSLESWSCRQ